MHIKSIACIALVASFLSGLALGWKIYSPKTSQSIVAKPSERQVDGSLVLAVEPSKKLEPKQKIPMGAKVERAVSLELKPSYSAPVAMDATNGTSQQDQGWAHAALKPLRIDLTQVTMSDGSSRVIASSPDGDITGGVDIQKPTTSSAQKNSISGIVGYDLRERKSVYGVQISRCVGPLSISAGFVGNTVFAGVGIRF